MKYIFTIICFLGLASHAIWAQQDAQYTQFMFNKLTLNPGYAGASGMPCLSAIHRQQWVGLEGAPVSSALSFNTSFSQDRVGFGLTLQHDQLGPTTIWNATMAYAYRADVGDGKLSFGIQANIRQYQVDWIQERVTHSGDNLLNSALQSKLLPNFGLGLYYESPSYYLGISAPHLLRGDLSLLDEFLSGNELNSLEEQHFFAMAGFLLNLNDKVKLKPAALLKVVKNTPIDADLNLSLIFMEKLWTGVSYRFGGSTAQGFGESIDFILQYQVSDGLRLGAGFDYTLSEINNYSSGTYEFFAHYCFKRTEEEVTNPRFF